MIVNLERLFKKALKVENKKLAIAHKKTCDCQTNHISCITAKEWVKGMVTIKEFYYTGRDVRDKNVHPAVYPISLPAHFIEVLTHEGELVLDPFVGIGTTLIAAQDLKRNALGFDLHEGYIEVAKERLSQTRFGIETQQLGIVDDAKNIPEYLEENTVSLCITSPPYANMLNRKRLNKSIRGDERKNGQYLKVQQYSKDPRDLGIMNYQQYAETLEEIYAGILPLMKEKAHCIVNINDVWWKNKRYVTHAYVIDALEKAGFEFRNTFIWDKKESCKSSWNIWLA